MENAMRTVEIEASEQYGVIVGTGILSRCAELILPFVSPCKAAVVAGDIGAALYAETLVGSLKAAGFDVCVKTFPHGEKSKNMETLFEILEFFAQCGLARTDAVFALGGGVTGDIAGLAAGLYMRGLKLVQIPTTLLAAVDSSVGGKTAVNLSAGKNLAGMFKQPAAVICDCSVFYSLTDEVFADGVAEAVKYGVLASPMLFDEFDRAGERKSLSADKICAIVADCVSIKARYVCADEFDRAERMMLNLGHTIGHAIEKVSGYEVSHGSAVSIGMVAAARASESMGIAQAGLTEKIASVLSKFGLPVSTDLCAAELARAALADKKRSGDTIELVLPISVGNCEIFKMPIANFERFIAVGLGESK